MTGTTFGDRVRSAREARHWTQAQLAQASRIAERTIRRVEKGEPFSAETLLSLCATLGIDSSSVATDTREKTSSLPEPEDSRHAERMGMLAGVILRSAPDALACAPDTKAHAMALFAGSTEALSRQRVASHAEPKLSYGLFFNHAVFTGCYVLIPLLMLGLLVRPFDCLVAIAATLVAGAYPSRVVWLTWYADRRYVHASGARRMLSEFDRERRTAYGLSDTRILVASIGGDASVDLKEYAIAGLDGVHVLRHRDGRHVSLSCKASGVVNDDGLALPWLPATAEVLAFAERWRGKDGRAMA